MAEDTLSQWAASLNGWHLPRWHELPQIELYMDQVVVFLEAQLGKLWLPEEKFITAAMINNYVKQGLLPKPIKKRYGRPQLARLIVITLSKQTVSLTDIKTAFDFALWEHDTAQVYDMFCYQQEQALTAAGSALLVGEEERTLLLLQLSAAAAASGLAAKRLLSIWDISTHSMIN